MNEIALELAHREHFTVPEWLEREKCIMAIRVFDKQRLLAEQALTQIRDKKLYRPYATLKEFCQRTFGWSDRRTQQVLAAEKVIAALPPSKRTIVRTESQARELVNVSPKKRVAVLTEAQRNGKITAESIREAAQRSDGDDKGSGVCSDTNGVAIPESSMAYWNRKPEAQQVLSQISKIRTEIKKLSPDDPMWSGINLNGVIADLNSAYNRFAASVPAYVCPVCKGEKPKGCKCCKGKGVLSEYFYRMVPEELKK